MTYCKLLGVVGCLITAASCFSSTPNRSNSTVRADKLHQQGITGTSVNVGVFEPGGRIRPIWPLPSNPYLGTNIIQENVTMTLVDPHAVAVTAVIAATDSQQPGVDSGDIARGTAYGAAVYVSGASDISKPPSTSQMEMGNLLAAFVNGHTGSGRLDVVNLSYSGKCIVADQATKIYDGLVINNRCTLVAAAGNLLDGTLPGDVQNPAVGFNIITVGAVDEHDTEVLSDDTMWNQSTPVNPGGLANDREKLDLSAPGVAVWTAYSNPLNAYDPTRLIQASGTSFAAPRVTGVVALLMQRASALKQNPEAVKAVLMVSAAHGISGNAIGFARRSSGTNRYPDTASGAGCVDASLADIVAARASGGQTGNWDSVEYRPAASPPVNAGFFDSNGMHQVSQPIRVRPGQRVRVCLVWANPVDGYAYYSTRSSADINLEIFRGPGLPLAVSDRSESNVELVDFVANGPGANSDGTDDYSIRFGLISTDAPPPYIAWAWCIVPKKTEKPREAVFRDLHPAGYRWSHVNKAAGGVAVGAASPESSPFAHAAMWTGNSADTFADLHGSLSALIPNLQSSAATGIDSDGTVVGWAEDMSGFSKGVKWSPSGAPSLVDPISPYWDAAYGIDQGHIIGHSALSSYYGGSCVWDANGAFHSLEPEYDSWSAVMDVSAGKQVGWVQTNYTHWQTAQAALWNGNEGSLVSPATPSGYVSSVARAISGDVIVGYATTLENDWFANPDPIPLWTGENHSTSAVRWTGPNLTATLLSPPDGYALSAALGTSGGFTVGYGNDSVSGASHLMLWEGESAVGENLQSYIPPELPWGYGLDVSEAGEIYGGAGDQEVRAFYLRLYSRYDLNGDGIVDDADLTIVLLAYGDEGGGVQGDANEHGVVDDADVTLIILHFGETM